jgi:uncharacterized DUF497 family protein
VPAIVSGDYEWDDAKAAANLNKHGVSFDEAALALDMDANEVAFEDSERSRTRSLVMSPRARALLVITTESGPRTRTVSARKAEPYEQRIYAQK